MRGWLSDGPFWVAEQRLASAFANAYAQGGGSQVGACGPPDDHVWCDGVVEAAAFNEAWRSFSSWEG